MSQQATDNSYKPLASLDDLEYIRVTQLARLLECPSQWRAIMLGEGVPGEMKYANIGTAVHLVIERFLAGEWETGPGPGWKEQEEYLAVMGVPAAERWACHEYCRTFMEPLRPYVFQMEHEFTLPLVKGAPPVRGHMDLVLAPPGAGLILWDHKTNRHFKGVDAWSGEWQPRLYSWAARCLWRPMTSPLSFVIGHVNLSNTVRWQPDPTDWFVLHDAYQKVWAEVLESRQTGAWREAPCANCAFCPVKAGCGTYRGEMARSLGALADLVPWSKT